MGTRSRIGYYDDYTKKIISVYCHWDGYLSHNGRILLNYYNDLDKVKELVSGGDISSLAEKCSCPSGHSYKTPIDGYTVYHGRDMGRMNVDPIVSDSMRDFNHINSGQELDYIYNWFGTYSGWLFRYHNKSDWRRLTSEIVK